MKTYIVDVDRPWETRPSTRPGGRLPVPVSPMSDADYQARVQDVAAKVTAIVAEEGGKLNAIFNALGSMSVTTTEAGRARIEKTENVLQVFESQMRWRPGDARPQ